ncbi:hypothetical protein L2750_19575 [Shewanella submarina]|uniref:Uncharacterized protein n=1 Tax=Shewanella submarina TaxID=2016376 RepID=A0ABV7G662_9GAMM|nr:hypothetical protein [Shewanella submarina]MCL1039326.1 hypothetical protein [Shewanella submarina]
MSIRTLSTLPALMLSMLAVTADAESMPKMTEEQKEMFVQMSIASIKQEAEVLARFAECTGKSEAAVEKSFAREIRACFDNSSHSEQAMEACMDNLSQAAVGLSEAEMISCMGISDEVVAIEQQLMEIEDRLDELMGIYPRSEAQEKELYSLQDKQSQLQMKLYQAGGENMSDAEYQLTELEASIGDNEPTEAQLEQLDRLYQQVQQEQMAEAKRVMELMQKNRQ